jgi:hypothetical protein
MNDVQKAAAGLFLAWCVNDAEEWFTLSDTQKDLIDKVPSWVPIPEELRKRGTSKALARRGILVMGAAFLAASVAGVVTHGRSPLFRGALLAFGVHGFIHLGASAMARGYTSGAVTAATTVIPYWLGARRVLAKAGLKNVDRSTIPIALLGAPFLLGVHVVDFLMMGEDALGDPPPPSLVSPGDQTIDQSNNAEEN